MSKLWYLYRGMPCCGYLLQYPDPVIEVVSESTIEQLAPLKLFVCRKCRCQIASTEPLLITNKGLNYLKAMYKPFDNGVVDEVLRETNERSESLQQVPSSVGHERPRTTAMQDRSRERTNVIWSGNELERRSVGASAQVLRRAHWPNMGKPTHNFGPKSRLVLLATEQSE